MRGGEAGDRPAKNVRPGRPDAACGERKGRTSLGADLARRVDFWPAVNAPPPPGAARRYNQRFQRLSVVPMVRSGSGGLMLTGRF